jgi:hypothetical protein
MVCLPRPRRLTPQGCACSPARSALPYVPCMCVTIGPHGRLVAMGAILRDNPQELSRIFSQALAALKQLEVHLRRTASWRQPTEAAGQRGPSAGCFLSSSLLACYVRGDSPWRVVHDNPQGVGFRHVREACTAAANQSSGWGPVRPSLIIDGRVKDTVCTATHTQPGRGMAVVRLPYMRLSRGETRGWAAPIR